MKVLFHIEIDSSRCKECGYCVKTCKKGVISIEEKVNEKGYHYAVPSSQENCVGCSMCAIMCPEAAIEIWRE